MSLWTDVRDIAFFSPVKYSMDRSKEASRMQSAQIEQNRLYNQMNNAKDYDFAQNSLLWKAQQYQQLGLNPMAVVGSAGASPAFPMQPPGVEGKVNHVQEGLLGGLQIASNAASSFVGLNLQLEQLKSMKLQNAQLSQELSQSGVPVDVSSYSVGPSTTGGIQLDPSKSVTASAFDRGKEASSTPLTKVLDVNNSTKDAVLKGDNPADAKESQTVFKSVLDNLEDMGTFVAQYLGLNNYPAVMNTYEHAYQEYKKDGKLWYPGFKEGRIVSDMPSVLNLPGKRRYNFAKVYNKLRDQGKSPEDAANEASLYKVIKDMVS